MCVYIEALNDRYNTESGAPCHFINQIQHGSNNTDSLRNKDNADSWRGNKGAEVVTQKILIRTRHGRWINLQNCFVLFIASDGNAEMALTAITCPTIGFTPIVRDFNPRCVFKAFRFGKQPSNDIMPDQYTSTPCSAYQRLRTKGPFYWDHPAMVNIEFLWRTLNYKIRFNTDEATFDKSLNLLLSTQLPNHLRKSIFLRRLNYLRLQTAKMADEKGVNFHAIWPSTRWCLVVLDAMWPIQYIQFAEGMPHIRSDEDELVEQDKRDCERNIRLATPSGPYVLRVLRTICL